jgi:hypothetical protein
VLDIGTVLMPRPVPDALLHNQVRWILFLGLYHLLRPIQTLTSGLLGLLQGAELDDSLGVDRRGVTGGRIGQAIAPLSIGRDCELAEVGAVVVVGRVLVAIGRGTFNYFEDL